MNNFIIDCISTFTVTNEIQTHFIVDYIHCHKWCWNRFKKHKLVKQIMYLSKLRYIYKYVILTCLFYSAVFCSLSLEYKWTWYDLIWWCAMAKINRLRNVFTNVYVSNSYDDKLSSWFQHDKLSFFHMIFQTNYRLACRRVIRVAGDGVCQSSWWLCSFLLAKLCKKY